MTSISLVAIGIVNNDRHDLRDDDWGDVISTITLKEDLSPDLLKGLDHFSHVEVVFIFDQLDSNKPVPDLRHPRNNPEWPLIGLLAQRSAYHPNPIGLTSAKIIGLQGRILTVQGLDAVDGTPVLDLKPVFREFQAPDSTQPSWVSELLKDYWKKT